MKGGKTYEEAVKKTGLKYGFKKTAAQDAYRHYRQSENNRTEAN